MDQPGVYPRFNSYGLWLDQWDNFPIQFGIPGISIIRRWVVDLCFSVSSVQDSSSMTRINVVPVQELHKKHLMGELHEITRVFGLVRKLKDRKINRFNFQEKVNPPKEYTLGSGHVKFFYDKLGFVYNRYQELQQEAIRRGINANNIERDSLFDGIDSFYGGDYTPTEDAIAINRQRLIERTKPEWA